MTFEDYWATIEKRNGWTPDTVVECKVSGLKKLAEQAFNKGAARTRKTEDFVDRVLGRGYGFDVRQGPSP